MRAGFGLRQLIASSPSDDDLPVRQIMIQTISEREHFRFPVRESQHDHAEGRLQLGHVVKLIENNLRVSFALDFNHHADAVAVGFVPEVGDFGDSLVAHERGDVFHEQGLIHLVGKLVHDNGLASAPDFLDVGLRAYADGAPAPFKIIFDPLLAENNAARREIGPFHIF